jgi:hypothetical protein
MLCLVRLRIVCTLILSVGESEKIPWDESAFYVKRASTSTRNEGAELRYIRRFQCVVLLNFIRTLNQLRLTASALRRGVPRDWMRITSCIHGFTL